MHDTSPGESAHIFFVISHGQATSQPCTFGTSGMSHKPAYANNKEAFQMILLGPCQAPDPTSLSPLEGARYCMLGPYMPQFPRFLPCPANLQCTPPFKNSLECRTPISRQEPVQYCNRCPMASPHATKSASRPAGNPNHNRSNLLAAIQTKEEFPHDN